MNSRTSRRARLLVLLLGGLSAGAAAAQTPFIREGADWRYLDDGSDQGTAWRAHDFDDSGWAVGPAQLGYGDGDEATLVSYGPDPNDKHITTYFRHDFQVSDPSAFAAIRFELHRDDGAVVYLNGSEVYRSNMTGPVDHLTLADATITGVHEQPFFAATVDASLLAPGRNTVAVEMHQRSSTSSDLSFDLRATGHAGPHVARGPYLQIATPTGVRVRWRALPASDGRVRYGPGPNSLTAFVDDALVSEHHEVELTGLLPGTRYYYSIGSSTQVFAGGDAEHYFETSPPVGSEAPLRVWVIGDPGTANGDARLVRDAYASFTGATHTSTWLMLGDNAYVRGREDEYQTAVFDTYPALLRKSAVFPTRGNHEAVASVYYGAFSLPAGGEGGGVPSGTEAYYSFDHGNVHFVCLDSEGSSRAVGGAMWTWAQADLMATAQPWIVAYWHHPPYTKGSHDSDTETNLIEMRENFLPLLEDHGVDLVLAGHSHSYERSFLLDGHYGTSDTLTSAMRVDPGDGREDSDGAYNKAAGPGAGAVYITAGNAGKVTQAALDHPIMVHDRARLGSVVIDVDGGRMDVQFLDFSGAVDDYFTLLNDDYEGTFCVASVSNQGCVATVEATGTASASSPAPFVLGARDLPPGTFGFLAYARAPSNFPLYGGRVCLGAGLQRLSPALTTGSGLCGGRLDYDFNARIQSGADPNLVPGTTVYAQFWYRDSPSGAGLSEAYQFTIQP